MSTLVGWIRNRYLNNGVRRSQQCRVNLQKRDETLWMFQSGRGSFLWFSQVQGKVSPLKAHFYQEKAKDLNKEMAGDLQFSSSLGWLHRWIHRWITAQRS